MGDSTDKTKGTSLLEAAQAVASGGTVATEQRAKRLAYSGKFDPDTGQMVFIEGAKTGRPAAPTLQLTLWLHGSANLPNPNASRPRVQYPAGQGEYAELSTDGLAFPFVSVKAGQGQVKNADGSRMGNADILRRLKFTDGQGGVIEADNIGINLPVSRELVALMNEALNRCGDKKYKIVPAE
jgi:hypothetical protein